MKMFRFILVLLAATIVSSMMLISCKSKSSGETKKETEAVGPNQLTQA